LSGLFQKGHVWSCWISLILQIVLSIFKAIFTGY
jgi:hypothetical protein